jgi:protocatechuate 4,5-dioxygenase beta chain
VIGVGDVDGPVEPWLNIARRSIENDCDLAEYILQQGVSQDVDWTVSKTMTLDHSVMIPYHFGVSACADIRVVPIYLACAVEPFLGSARARTIGRITGEAIRSFPADRRVAIIGTGGLSHWVGMAQMGQVNETWDRRILDHVLRGNLDALVAMREEDIIAEAGNGALEIKNWIFALAAAGALRPELIAYEPVQEWVSGLGFVELGVD